MSKKHLARTVIEGGRARFNQEERRLSHRGERASTREWLSRGDTDGEAAPVRRHVGKSFDDKLGVPRRWLRSKVGEPWDAVYAEIKQRFDTRTTAGRHILYDHMLHWVAKPGDPERTWSHPDFVVGADGILTEGAPRRRHRSPWALEPGKVRRSREEIDAWAANRRVGVRGGILFWFVEATVRRDFVCTDHQCPHAKGREAQTHQGLFFRQHRRFTDDEVQFWTTLPTMDQKTLLYLQ